MGITMAIKIDLITGFLGAGKTTFLKYYCEYLLSKGEKIGILENDFGAINIDVLLLNDLKDKVGIEMVSGGCDADCHKRRFKTQLISMKMMGYTRIIVEPSGIYDLDEFFDTLHEYPLDDWYQIDNVISIVDANIDTNISFESRYVFASQIALSGKIVLSKVQLANPNEIENTLDFIGKTLKEFNCSYDFKNDLIIKPFKDIDFDAIVNASYSHRSIVKLPVFDSSQYETLFFMNKNYKIKDFSNIIDELFCDKTCGNVIRVKGYIFDNNKWYEINITKQDKTYKEVTSGQDVIIVIGESLNSKEIFKYLGEMKLD